jgi:pimeloyl-ACP methyl ester carboxylesterase
MTPFAQGPFADLPLLPRIPHRFYALAEERVTTSSAGLGVVEWSLRRVGSGPPLLLIHGLMTTGYSWRYVVDALAEHFTVFIPDLPGAGRTVTPEGRLSPGVMADAIAALIEALGIRGCPVVGNSMGGYLCMHLALRHPDMLSRLLVLHAPGIPEARLYTLWLALRLPGAQALLGALVRWNPLRWAHRNVHYFDESLKSVEEAKEYGEPLVSAVGLSGFYRQLRDMMDVRQIADFVRTLEARRAANQGFGLPLLLLYARADPMVPPRVGPALAALIPDARLAWAEEGSHFLHVDRPALFLSEAVPFLKD